jgi:hypothetical protein
VVAMQEIFRKKEFSRITGISEDGRVEWPLRSHRHSAEVRLNRLPWSRNRYSDPAIFFETRIGIEGSRGIQLAVVSRSERFLAVAAPSGIGPCPHRPHRGPPKPKRPCAPRLRDVAFRPATEGAPDPLGHFLAGFQILGNPGALDRAASLPMAIARHIRCLLLAGTIYEDARRRISLVPHVWCWLFVGGLAADCHWRAPPLLCARRPRFFWGLFPVLGGSKVSQKTQRMHHFRKGSSRMRSDILDRCFALGAWRSTRRDSGRGRKSAAIPCSKEVHDPHSKRNRSRRGHAPKR